jgi:hypothetical protein
MVLFYWVASGNVKTELLQQHCFCSAAAIVWLFAKMYLYAQQQELQQPLHKINL